MKYRLTTSNSHALCGLKIAASLALSGVLCAENSPSSKDQNPQQENVEEKSDNSEQATNQVQADLTGKLSILKDDELAGYEFSGEADYFIFYFTAKFCPGCDELIESSKEFYQQKVAPLETVDFIMVNGDNSKEVALEWMKKHSMPWPTLFKSQVRAEKIVMDSLSKVNSTMPRMILVDAQGKAIVFGRPDQIKEALNEALEEIKQGKIPTPVENPKSAKPAQKIPVDEIL